MFLALEMQLLSYRIVTSSLLLLLHLEVNVFAVQRNGGGAVCRCMQMCADSKTLLVWNDPDLLTYALKKVQI